MPGDFLWFLQKVGTFKMKDLIFQAPKWLMLGLLPLFTLGLIIGYGKSWHEQVPTMAQIHHENQKWQGKIIPIGYVQLKKIIDKNQFQGKIQGYWFTFIKTDHGLKEGEIVSLWGKVLDRQTFQLESIRKHPLRKIKWIVSGATSLIVLLGMAYLVFTGRLI